MKKYLILLSILLVGFISIAQTPVTRITSADGGISMPSYFSVWGTTADTLTNADTLNYVISNRGNNVRDFKMWLYSDFVSGTAGGTLIVYGSPDGTNYLPLDTITITGLTADALDSETLILDDCMEPYIKLIYLQTGTAVTVPKVYGMTRYN